jgi:hypothetical protein
MKVCRKGYTTIRDNAVVYLFNHLGWFQTANIYSWITTEMVDTLSLVVAGKIGATTIEGKFLILLIITFII